MGWIHDLQSNLLKAVALTLNSHWQHHAVEWLSETHAMLRWGDRNFSKYRKSASPKEIDGHMCSLRGASIAEAPEYGTITELHLVANAVRHGPGRSLNELRAAHPKLWREEQTNGLLRPWYLPEDEPMANFTLTEGDVRRYKEGLCMFWSRIAGSAFNQMSQGAETLSDESRADRRG